MMQIASLGATLPGSQAQARLWDMLVVTLRGLSCPLCPQRLHRAERVRDAISECEPRMHDTWQYGSSQMPVCNCAVCITVMSTCELSGALSASVPKISKLLGLQE